MVDLARTRLPDAIRGDRPRPFTELLEDHADEWLGQIRQYAHDQPVSFAALGFGIGFVLGWKLKPW